MRFPLWFRPTAFRTLRKIRAKPCRSRRETEPLPQGKAESHGKIMETEGDMGGFFVLSFGGNTGYVRAAFCRALCSLSKRSDLRLLGSSPIRRTRPWGIVSPDFLNMVVVGYSRTGSPGIFSLLLRLERKDRPRGKGKLYPRTLDLDFLLFSGPPSPMKDLLLPHPRLDGRPELLELLDAARRRERSGGYLKGKGICRGSGRGRR